MPPLRTCLRIVFALCGFVLMYAEQTLKHTATLEKMSDFRTKTFQAFFVNHEASHTDFPIQKDVSLNLNCLSHYKLT